MSRFKVSTDQGNGMGAGLYYKEAAPARIDVTNEESLSQWEKSLGLERKELLEAIKLYGPVGRDIRRGLLRDKEDKAA